MQRETFLGANEEPRRESESILGHLQGTGSSASAELLSHPNGYFL